MCAVMLAMKTMLPPVRWSWSCFTASWAAKKEPRDWFFVLVGFFFFFLLGKDVSYVDFENFGDFAPGLVDKGFVNSDAGCGDEAVDFA